MKVNGKGVKEIREATGREKNIVYKAINNYLSVNGLCFSWIEGKCLEKSKVDEETLAYVIEGLKEGLSSQQITGRMKKLGRVITVSHEWIYQRILRERRQGGKLYKCLRHRMKYYKRRGHKRTDVDGYRTEWILTGDHLR